MSNLPKCYVESPLGFEPTRADEYERFLEQIRPVAEPINPFFIAGQEFIPEILELSGQEKQERWCDMAVRLYEVIETEADMGFSIMNGEPTDVGTGCEMAAGYMLHKAGVKPFPLVAYREDYRNAGETDNNLNAMLLPPYMRTGGVFVSKFDEITDAIGTVAAALPELRDKFKKQLVEFPLYKIIFNGQEHWLPARRAGAMLDFGWAPVEIGGLVLDEVGATRPITNQERTRIADIADDFSASK